MSSIVLPTGTRGWNRMPGLRRRRDLLFGFRAADLELIDIATGQPISFSRASPGGLVPVLGGSGASRGTVLSGPHAHDVPRFVMLDRDGDGFPETPALRLERAGTNGWSWSEVLGNSLWVKVGASIATNVARAPDGTMTMDKVVENTTTGVHGLQRATPPLADNAPVAVTAFARAGERSFLRIRFLDKAEVAHGAYFDLTTGQVTSIANTVTARAHRVGDTWRLECVFNASSGATAPQVYFRMATGDGGDAYEGDGSSGIYLWGIQIEADIGAASSYIRTEGSAAARATDTVIAPWVHGLISCSPYFRFVETGAAELSAATIAVWTFGDDIGNGRIWLRSVAATPTYAIFLRDARGVASEVSASPGITTQIGDLVELMPQIEVSAQGVRARLIQAVNGGAPATSAWTPYVQADWTPTTMRLGSFTPTQFDLLDFFVLYGAGWTMDAARRVAGVA